MNTSSSIFYPSVGFATSCVNPIRVDFMDEVQELERDGFGGAADIRSVINKFTLQKVNYKATLYQTFHNSGYYRGVVDRAVICTVMVCTRLMNGSNHRFSILIETYRH